MAVWSLRSSGYKLGVLLFFLASAFYLIGYSSPFWIQYKKRYYYGLWQVCHKPMYRYYHERTTCSSMMISGHTEGWFKAVQAMESLGLIGLIITGVYAVVVNCCQMAPSHTRFLEILAGASGGTGFIGCMIFVGKTHETSKFYGWAFGLNLTGCLLMIVAAIIIFGTNRADLPTPVAGGMVIAAPSTASTPMVTTSGAPGPVQGMNMVVVQQGQVYPGQTYPPQPGVGYLASPGYGYPQGYSGVAQYPGGYFPATAPPPPQPSNAPPPPQPSNAPPPPYSALGFSQGGYSGGQVESGPEPK